MPNPGTDGFGGWLGNAGGSGVPGGGKLLRSGITAKGVVLAYGFFSFGTAALGLVKTGLGPLPDRVVSDASIICVF